MHCLSRQELTGDWDTKNNIEGCNTTTTATHTAPLSIESIKKEQNRAKYFRVQRLISLRIAKAYCTTSHKALCILTSPTPINIKAEDVVTLHNITTGRNNQKYRINKAENSRNWLHPADRVSATTQQKAVRRNCGISSRMAARAKKEGVQGLQYLQGRYSRNNLNSS